jgi:hypothetical protein
MAKRQSTSNVRARRSRTTLAADTEHGGAIRKSSVAVNATGVPDLGQGVHQSSSLVDLLQDERGRLSDAQSVLGCLHVALLHADDGRLKEEPDYAAAARIALALVREAANRLDYARLQPLVDALSSSPARGKSSSLRHG